MWRAEKIHTHKETTKILHNNRQHSMMDDNENSPTKKRKAQEEEEKEDTNIAEEQPSESIITNDDDELMDEKHDENSEPENVDDDNGDDKDNDVETENAANKADETTATVDEDENGDNAEEGNDSGGGETEGTGDDVDAVPAAATAAAPTVLVERPAKRSRTAYFIFADVMRPSLRQEFPGESVGTQAKRIGQKWKELTGEEKEPYHKTAAEEKDKYRTQLEAYTQQQKAIYGDQYVDEEARNKDAEGNRLDDPMKLIFPVARINKIAKLDPDVKAISKEAMHVIVKATELFLRKAGNETVKVAAMLNRRTLHASDVCDMCAHRSEYEFLKVDMQDYTKQQLHEKQQAAATAVAAGSEDSNIHTTDGSKPVDKKTAKLVAAAAGSKPLTSYFAAAAPPPAAASSKK